MPGAETISYVSEKPQVQVCIRHNGLGFPTEDDALFFNWAIANSRLAPDEPREGSREILMQLLDDGLTAAIGSSSYTSPTPIADSVSRLHGVWVSSKCTRMNRGSLTRHSDSYHPISVVTIVRQPLIPNVFLRFSAGYTNQLYFGHVKTHLHRIADNTGVPIAVLRSLLGGISLDLGDMQ